MLHRDEMMKGKAFKYLFLGFTTENPGTMFICILFDCNAMRIPQMQPYDIRPKGGPYDPKMLVKMKKDYVRYMSKQKTKLRPVQLKRLENIVKTIDFAEKHPKMELTPRHISKNIGVSEIIARSYIHMIYLETNSKI